MTELSPEEFRRWIREYSGRLLSLMESFADGHTEAEDLLQETWIVAWNNADRRHDDGSVGSWLYQIALNVGRQHARKRSRRKKLFNFWGMKEEPVTGSASPSLERAQLHRRLWRAIARLPAVQQEVLLRRLVDGMSTRDTARDINKTEGTVKVYLHRATQTLKEELGDLWAEALKNPHEGGTP